jgi:hypothetical protein
MGRWSAAARRSATGIAMKHNWKFITTADEDASAWCWVHCVERSVFARTDFRFARFPDCLADALYHGFQASHPFDVFKDRRKTPRLAA